MSQNTPADLQAKVEEFRRLYVNAQTGIVSADLIDHNGNKLSVSVSDWSALQKIPQPSSEYQGIPIVWGFHVPDGVALAPGFQVQGPAPVARRNHSDVCTCTNCKEANEALAKAAKLNEANKNGLARRQLGFAIKTLEKLRPRGENMAQAYLDMAFLVLFARARNKAQRKQNGLDAVAWYEKAIKVWEENGNTDSLGGNLTNLGSLYFRIGDYETSLARNLRGRDRRTDAAVRGRFARVDLDAPFLVAPRSAADPVRRRPVRTAGVQRPGGARRTGLRAPARDRMPAQNTAAPTVPSSSAGP